MPKPVKGETERDYLKRCIPELIHEGYPQQQAIAVCFSVYRREGTEEKSPKPEKHNMDMPEPSGRKAAELPVYDHHYPDQDNMYYGQHDHHNYGTDHNAEYEWEHHHPYGHRHPNYHSDGKEHMSTEHSDSHSRNYDHLRKPDHYDHDHSDLDEVDEYGHVRRASRRRGFIVGSRMNYGSDYDKRKVKYAANRYL